ncbi:MAG: glycosyltransferase [Bacteroidetes bacterium]|nr:glycosyltransferase [Bacteroidota bacterium]
MKVSLITVCLNSEKYIQTCIDSVLSQDYPHIEYIIIDGKSTDQTVDIVKSYGERINHFVSESDKGLYDAMNKGIDLATGDIVGILNADDVYAHNQVISRMVSVFEQENSDVAFADLVYVKEENLDEVVRYFPGKGFHPGWFAKGLMPPHPTFFVRKKLYDQYGKFNTWYKICADFDLMVRLFHTYQASYTYLPEVIVKMRVGGNSAWGKNTLTINREMLHSCKSHGIPTSLLRIYSKYLLKIFQLIKKPKT